MMLPKVSTALLEALSEPVLLVAAGGTVLHANRAAVALLGGGLAGQPVSAFHVGDADALRTYLNRCLGTRQPLVGGLQLAGQATLRKFQCRGSLVIADGDRAILLRLSRGDEENFAALTRKVEELSRELNKRQRAEALLKEALRERELLLRELQHRVKNNMHMLAAMLLGAEREAGSEEAKAALRDASLRFSTVSAVQQLLYNSEDLESIGSEALVATLLRAALCIAPDKPDTEVSVEPMDLPIDAAVPIALMLNELLTNAIKYGRPSEQPQKLKVAFLHKGQQIELLVQDNGPGFDLGECRKRASGLGLVRGLLRQLGGSISIEQNGGARCAVSFPDPRRKTVRSAA